jgi:hypothetical protein
MPEATGAALGGFEIRYDLEFDLHHGHDDELRNALSRVQREVRIAVGENPPPTAD